jgi:peroxiredoxin Q/BCP
MLSQGDQAPDLILPDQHGTNVRLSDHWAVHHVVLFFYPKDDTPGCTREACGFRDQYEALAARHTEVIGISGDGAASHQRFIAKYDLPFTLLSDPDGEARKAFKVPRTLGLWPGRATYVIERGGTIRASLNTPFAPDRHVQLALDSLQDQRSG